MGGGPASDDEHEQVEQDHPGGPGISEQQQQFYTLAPEPVVVRETRERPVLASVIEGGLVGGIIGSLFGFGSVFGSTAGALAGATLASRDDATGQKTRAAALEIKSRVETSMSTAIQRVNNEPAGREVLAKLSNVMQSVSDAGEKYRVQERAESVAQKVVEIAEPKVRQVLTRVAEADPDGAVRDKATAFLGKVDQSMGLTRSFDAIRRELKL